MPELPEVQTLVDDLNRAGLAGAAFTGARVYWQRSVAVPAPREFCRRLKNRRIRDIRRRGKFIVFDLTGGGHLMIHLRMSGRLHLVASGSKRSKHEHVVLCLGDRQLRLHDTRKFGRVFLVEDERTLLGPLGVEPLEKGFTAAALGKLLRARKRMIKPLLLDQTVIAGLGNIYADESLWDARIHPGRLSNTLTSKEIRALHRAIPRALQCGLENLGTSLGTGKANFYSVARHRGRNQDCLQVFRRTGEPCPRCRTPIKRIIVGQRSTHICPRCQPLEAWLDQPST